MTQVKCWDCGNEGHIASACPVTASIPASGTWCGSCDERTRLVDLGDKMTRCRECHPKRGQLLAQFLHCPSCHEVIYVWDHQECYRHQPVGQQFQHVDLPKRTESKDLRMLAAQQVAEAHAARQMV